MAKQVTMSFEEYDEDLMQAKVRGEHEALIQYEEILRSCQLQAVEESVMSLLEAIKTGDMNNVFKLNCTNTDGLKFLAFVLAKGLSKINEETKKSVDKPADIVVES